MLCFFHDHIPGIPVPGRTYNNSSCYIRCASLSNVLTRGIFEHLREIWEEGGGGSGRPALAVAFAPDQSSKLSAVYSIHRYFLPPPFAPRHLNSDRNSDHFGVLLSAVYKQRGRPAVRSGSCRSRVVRLLAASLGHHVVAYHT